MFRNDIADYLTEVRKHGIDLVHFESQYRDYTQTTPPGYDHKKVCDGIDREQRWFDEQTKIAHQKFGRYLSLT